MEQHSIPYGSSNIGYTLYGRGRRLLLCMHGYGESAASFAFLEATLGAEFTLLAIDMPFHGRTEWKEGFFLDPAVLVSLIGEIVARLPGLEGGWWLLGYSMGGRMALQLLEMVPDRVERLVLVAPDGLKMNRWYWLATQTGSGNRLFRWTMRRPGWLFFVLRAGHFLRLVNPGIYKFAVYYIADEQVRQDLYIRWTTLRGFRPDIGVVRELIASRKIPVRLLYGKFDRIIRWETGERFRQKLPTGSCQLRIVASGHQLLQEKNLLALVATLKD
jgi:pimeloyl-ACP methyl ester carboxylesterase